MAKKKFLSLDATQAWSLGGLVAAMAIAILINVLGARHYKRADWTRNKLYTLTPATVDTLHGLADRVEVWVLLGGGDPMEQNVRHLLDSYEGETTKLDVHYIDPDKDALALDDVRKRFKIQTGRTEDGRVVADAILVVAHGDRHWFLTPSDMVEVSSADDVKVKPREEQAITGAIRNVTAGAKTKLCFLAGHGERALDDGSDDGLGLLRDILEKDNYETETVDSTPQNAFEPFKGCAVVIVAPPSIRSREFGALTDAEATRLRTYLLGGGNMLLALGAESDLAAVSFQKVLAPFGIGTDERLVLDPDPRVMIPDTRANTFVVTAKPHPVTAALTTEGDTVKDPPRIILDTTRALHHVEGQGATAQDLLVTSDQSFSVDLERAKSIIGTNVSEVPEKQAGDVSGPFVVAMASERAKVSKDAAHGPRVVVIGSTIALSQPNWRAPVPWRGAAFLVENSISWLASQPQVLDIPARPSIAAGIKISEESRSEVRRYVLVYMPLAALLVGLAIGLRRRSTEGAPRKGATPKTTPRDARRGKKPTPKKVVDEDEEDATDDDDTTDDDDEAT